MTNNSLHGKNNHVNKDVNYQKMYCQLFSSNCDQTPKILTPEAYNTVVVDILRRNIQAQAQIQSLHSQIQDFEMKHQTETVIKNISETSLCISAIQKSFHSICNGYETKIKELEANNKQLQNDCSQNKEHLKKYKKYVTTSNDLQSENENLKDTILNLQSKLDLKEKECDAMANKILKDKRKIQQLKETIKSDKSKQIINEYQGEIADLNAQVDILKTKKQKLEVNNDQLQNTINLNNEHINDLKKMIENMPSSPKVVKSLPAEKLNLDTLKNPFTGEFSIKYDKIMLMNHFEPYQRVQLLFNEAAREIKSLNDTISNLQISLKEQKGKTDEIDDKYNDTYHTLHHLLNKFHKLAANERLFDKSGLVVDARFMDFFRKHVGNQEENSNSDRIVTDLIQQDSLACSIVSSLMLANAKQNEQIIRLIDQVSEREMILENIRCGGIPPEKVVDTIENLRNENGEFKQNLRSLRNEIVSLNRSIDLYDEANNKIDKLQNDLNKSQQFLMNMETDLAEKSNKVGMLSSKNADLNQEIARLRREIADIMNDNADLRNEVKKYRKSHDTSSSRISDMKRLLNEALAKIERLKSENSRLSGENKKLFDKVARTSNYTLAANREKQRIMNLIAREVGGPYNVSYFEPDDESIFVAFIRRIRDDLKKLRIFQSSNPSY